MENPVHGFIGGFPFSLFLVSLCTPSLVLPETTFQSSLHPSPISSSTWGSPNQQRRSSFWVRDHDNIAQNHFSCLDTRGADLGPAHNEEAPGWGSLKLSCPSKLNLAHLQSTWSPGSMRINACIPLRFCGPQQNGHVVKTRSQLYLSLPLHCPVSVLQKHRNKRFWRLGIGKENYEVRLRTLNHVARLRHWQWECAHCY